MIAGNGGAGVNAHTGTTSIGRSTLAQNGTNPTTDPQWAVTPGAVIVQIATNVCNGGTTSGRVRSIG